jgi:hypothetical protein
MGRGEIGTAIPQDIALGGAKGIPLMEHFAGTKILLETNTSDSAEGQ